MPRTFEALTEREPGNRFRRDQGNYYDRNLGPATNIDDAISQEDLEDASEGMDNTNQDPNALRPMTDDEIQQSLRFLIDESVDFSESELSQDRIVAQKYYNGSVDIGFEDGRSSTTVSRVRDVVRGLMPGIMRVFTASDDTVEFLPTSQQDAKLAEDATKYANWIFNEKNDGYGVVYEAASDSLVKKIGIVKVWWDDTPVTVTRNHEDLDQEGYDELAADPDWTITEESTADNGLVDVVAVREFPQGLPKCQTIPPEDFHTNRRARSLADCRIALHRENKHITDLVEMGFDYEVVSRLNYEDNSTTDAEDDYRRSFVARNHDDTETPQDPTSSEVLVCDVYAYMDADGDGVAELRHFITGGTQHHILFEERVDFIPFARFCSEIEPHAFYPKCIADMLLQDQDAATVLIRGVLDNVQLTNNPQREVNENAVNLEDAMNAEIGALVRVRQMGQINDLTVPFVAGQTLPVMQYLDQIVEARSGVSKLSSGLNSDVLQSTATPAVDAVVDSAQSMAELIARNLAETGMKEMFKIILKLSIQNQNGPTSMRDGKQFKEVDPRFWHSQMDMKVNVGLGNGQPQQRLVSLEKVAGKQEQVIQMFGPSSPYMKVENVFHTYREMLSIIGYKDSTPFFPEINPQEEQEFQKQQQQNQQQQNPAVAQMEALKEVEQMKAKLKQATDQAKLAAEKENDQANNVIEIKKAQMEDDRLRDKVAVEAELTEAEIKAKYGAQVNRDRMNAEVNRERYHEQSTVNAAGQHSEGGEVGGSGS